MAYSLTIMDRSFGSRNSFLSLITHLEVVMRMKSHLELIPADAFGFFMSFYIRISPISYGAYKLVRSQQDLLPVVALHNLKLLFIVLSQSSASMGSTECEKVGGLVLWDSPSLSLCGGCGAN
jgi:hypothetical protein